MKGTKSQNWEQTELLASLASKGSFDSKGIF
jgi:hypothetical protein